MAHERLLDRNAPPSDQAMLDVIGAPLAEAWTELRRFLTESYDLVPLLQFGGPRYGWNLQHRKGGRPLAELYPECGSFCALVVLGKKELEEAINRLETFSPLVQSALTDTPRFHDGCWMYIRVTNPDTCRKEAEDIEQLIMIKRKPVKKKT